MRARGITVESVESIVSLGIMWMNTPNWYKPDITP